MKGDLSHFEITPKMLVEIIRDSLWGWNGRATV